MSFSLAEREEELYKHQLEWQLSCHDCVSVVHLQIYIQVTRDDLYSGIKNFDLYNFYKWCFIKIFE